MKPSQICDLTDGLVFLVESNVKNSRAVGPDDIQALCVALRQILDLTRRYALVEDMFSDLKSCDPLAWDKKMPLPQQYGKELQTYWRDLHERDFGEPPSAPAPDQPKP